MIKLLARLLILPTMALASAAPIVFHHRTDSKKLTTPPVVRNFQPDLIIHRGPTERQKQSFYRIELTKQRTAAIIKLDAALKENAKWAAIDIQTKAVQANNANRAKQQTQQRSYSAPAASAPTFSGTGIPYDYDLWMNVHHCEQGDTWHAGGHFGNGLAAGGNGLGFSADAWAMGVRMAADRGVTIPASGWDASPDQQMQLAQAVLDRTGGGPDCLSRFR